MKIFQTDIPPFPKAFDEACYFMSILWQLNRIFGKPEWTHEAILEVYNSEELDHDLDPDLTVEQPQRFIEAVVGINRVLFQGKFDPFYPTASDQFEILVYHKDGTTFNHFVAGTGHGLVAYDPWSAEGSESVRNGSCIGKRIFKVI
jgi:hypothetical protein